MEGLLITRLKPNVQITQKGPLYYQLDQQGRPIRFQPKIGDVFAFLYDFIMAHSIFPKKFNAGLEPHKTILSGELKDVHNQRILELGTGSGCAATFLHPNNRYLGSDINTGLLKKAVKRFNQAGFQNAEFYVASGDDLPFSLETFDLCLCLLSLNFIRNYKEVFEGIHALLRPGGRVMGCVPVPKHNRNERTIHGMLLTEVRLQNLCHQTGFEYDRIQVENGALLYFWACKSEK